ncbi:RNB domain-containing ribonuclease [uncultured Methanoregula sp.]|uniref:RNB domain-containing ribonuclease n=1 Tax=uncultured Methanoregula sp. TaxID=1005933 RepID=UPI002AAADF16|nr:RNB domain-containing ribonuclease [uncultured Methanoregula sp.]
MKRQHTVDLKAIAWSAMEKYGFLPAFPQAVIREVDAIHETAPSDEGEALDLRSLLWSSIDNSDSEDLDQIEYCEQNPDGSVHVRVAIADVDAYVPKNSRADQYAANNGTSVYLDIGVFPLFPDRLSKGITSLLPGHDHRAIISEYTVMADGHFEPGNVYRALVRNKAKLVYEEVGDWLEGTGKIPAAIRDTAGMEDQIRLQDKTAQLLKEKRLADGALDLDTIEPKAVIENGSVREIIVIKKNPARSIIEEFMVAANGTLVRFLGNAGISMIQRIVRVPKYWDEIVLTALLYGEHLPKEPEVKALSDFLFKQKAADPERFPDLSLTIIKLLGPGEYMALDPGTPPTGHFSLAVTDYTHSTAPNRRYVDLINQRLVKGLLDHKASPYSSEDLARASAWLTDREKASKKAERFMRKAAAAVLLANRIGDTFDALVTGASEKGTYVRLLDPPAEGKVIRSEHGLRVGMKIRVRLLRTDPPKGFIDFERVSGKGVLPG